MLKTYYSEQIKKSLVAYGWEQLDAGGGRASDYNKCAAVFVRKRTFKEIGFTSLQEKSAIPYVPTDSASSHKTTMGDVLKSGMRGSLDDSSSLSYSDDSFLAKLRENGVNSLLVRFDVLYDNRPDRPINYIVSFYYDDMLYDFIYFPLCGQLSISYMLGRCFDHIGVKRYYRTTSLMYECIVGFTDSGKAKLQTFKSKKDAINKANYVYHKKTYRTSNIPVSDYDQTKHMLCKPIINSDVCLNYNVSLLFNNGIRFLASVECDDVYDYIVDKGTNYIKELNSGIFSGRCRNLYISSCSNNGYQYIYPISMYIRDVIHHSNVNYDNILDYSNAVNYPSTDYIKLNNVKLINQHMLSFYLEHPYEYIEYACELNDTYLLYVFSMYGINKLIPCTFLSGTAHIVKESICRNMNWSEKDFDFHYNGKIKVKKATNNKFIGTMDYANNEIQNVNRMAADSYAGGYNHCIQVVCHSGYDTFDVDANNGYPTVMSMLPLVDWANPVKEYIYNRYLTLEDFNVLMNQNNIDSMSVYPFLPMFCYCDFQFDKNDKFPNLGVKVKEDKENITVYPLTSTDGNCYSGIELYLALMKGAKVYVRQGIILNVKYNDDGSMIYVFRDLMHDLVIERMDACIHHGKGSLSENTIKLSTNGIYGKASQGVTKISEDKDTLNESVITNPVFASMTTAGMRALLFAAMSELSCNNVNIQSATTDGFITDGNIDEINSLNLFGLQPLFVAARQYLTDDDDAKIWALKHQQNDLLNLTTRANVSLIVGDKDRGILPGVAAFGGISRAHPELAKEEYLNRYEFRKNVVTRKGPLEDESKLYPKIDDIKKGVLYVPKIIKKKISMNYDFKRKPMRETFKPAYVEYDGVEYEFAQFDTEPYKDKNEFLLYRSVAKTCVCLRTMDEWEDFFEKLEKAKRKAIGYDEFDILYNIVYLHKKGKIIIPAIAELKTVPDKIKWINDHNTSEKEFTINHWRHASDPLPKKKQIPMDILEDHIRALTDY